MTLVFDWTEERVALLRQRRAEHVTASAIAEELGCSRNAVLGKAMRLARTEDPGAADFRSAPRPSRRPSPRARDVQLLDEVLACQPETGKPLWSLRAFPCECRWVLNTGAPWVFCGEPVHKKSMCKEHWARCYVPYKKGED